VGESRRGEDGGKTRDSGEGKQLESGEDIGGGKAENEKDEERGEGGGSGSVAFGDALLEAMGKASEPDLVFDELVKHVLQSAHSAFAISAVTTALRRASDGAMARTRSAALDRLETAASSAPTFTDPDTLFAVLAPTLILRVLAQDERWICSAETAQKLWTVVAQARPDDVSDGAVRAWLRAALETTALASPATAWRLASMALRRNEDKAELEDSTPMSIGFSSVSRDALVGASAFLGALALGVDSARWSSGAGEKGDAAREAWRAASEGVRGGMEDGARCNIAVAAVLAVPDGVVLWGRDLVLGGAEAWRVQTAWYVAGSAPPTVAMLGPLATAAARNDVYVPALMRAIARAEVPSLAMPPEWFASLRCILSRLAFSPDAQHIRQVLVHALHTCP